MLDVVIEKSTAERDAEQAGVDEFRLASRLFSFRSHAPTQTVFAEKPKPAAEEPPVPVAGASTGRKALFGGQFTARASLRRMTAASFSVGVMGLVGLMTVGMTMPAEAVPHEHPTETATALPGDAVDPASSEIQAYIAPAQGGSADLARTENYSVATLGDLAGAVGVSNFSSSVFTNDQTCPIQWPYAVGVPMSYGFGIRDGRMHEGIDFTPGAGAQIQAIADGVVRTATDDGGAFGVTIVIDHVVDGQQVSSRYAHMDYGSRQVEVGDTVSAGQYIGRTGNSGRSFGAHLHLEMLQNGTTAVDPLPWLRANASC
ncbi:MAG: M23 family metallopeptidase [Vicinamibacterales bacterium]|nr:M23 family metallopeptidase [Vicinamibacterales bacterium]